MEINLDDEIWLPAIGYEGRYEISNMGNVRSLIYNKLRTLRLGTNQKGYHQVLLCINGIRKNEAVHRLVAKAFIPNPDGKATVNHINGIPKDNRVENLEWATQSENNKHMYDTGLNKWKGENHYKSKVSNVDIDNIRTLYKNEVYNQCELAKLYNMDQSSISYIINKKSRV